MVMIPMKRFAQERVTKAEEGTEKRKLKLTNNLHFSATLLFRPEWIHERDGCPAIQEEKEDQRTEVLR